jgi:hypothetical protein
MFEFLGELFAVQVEVICVGFEETLGVDDTRKGIVVVAFHGFQVATTNFSDPFYVFMSQAELLSGSFEGGTYL